MMKAAAGMGMALAAIESKARTIGDLMEYLEKAAETLDTRPTASNLKWATNRMLDVAKKTTETTGNVDEVVQRLVDEAKEIAEEDVRMSRNMGEQALKLIKPGYTIQTICNAGSLATGGYGTATGPIRVAVEQGKNIQVGETVAATLRTPDGYGTAVFEDIIFTVIDEEKLKKIKERSL